MDETVFWDLLGSACRMGRFVAAVPNAAAAANIVGKLELGRDGAERVLQKKNRPGSHIHFRPERIAEFAFVHLDPGPGPEPCLELRTAEGHAVLRLYYQGRRPAVGRYDEFVARHPEHKGFITGSWSNPAEEVAAGTSIFVSNNHDATERDDAPVA
ncbi:MAG: hypothetical protein ACRD68_05845 [Pyrinomonadaceae bacterium]